ncbi:MAG: hypothetical protein ACR2LZ_09915 [Pyrinomonadaceae bacterium]
MELKAMRIVTLQSHFDGKQILLDEPYDLAPNTKLVVSVIQMQNEEREDWTRFSLANLERAYGDNEPEYSLDLIKEANPKYEGR